MADLTNKKLIDLGLLTTYDENIKEHIDNAIDDKVATLDYTDSAESGKFVTKVDEADGVIEVTRAALTASDIPDLTTAKITDAGTAAKSNVATVAFDAEGEVGTALPTVAQIKDYVTTKVSGLAGAVHFRGVVDSLNDVTNPQSGDIAIVGVKEYVYNGTAWQELGDEGAYVVKEDGKSLIATTEITRLAGMETGAQVNVLEGVQVNGTDLTIDGNKKVNVTVAEGATNGTVAVNGSDVSVHGLKSAAYADTTEFDTAGTATTKANAVKNELIGNAETDTADSNTIAGAKKYAASAATTAASNAVGALNLATTADIQALFDSDSQE